MLNACLQQGSFVETNAVKWIQWRAHHTPTVAFMSFHWKGVEREEKYPAFFVNEANNNNNNGTHEKMACPISSREGLVHCTIFKKFPFQRLLDKFERREIKINSKNLVTGRYVNPSVEMVQFLLQLRKVSLLRNKATKAKDRETYSSSFFATTLIKTTVVNGWTKTTNGLSLQLMKVRVCWSGILSRPVHLSKCQIYIFQRQLINQQSR